MKFAFYDDFELGLVVDDGIAPLDAALGLGGDTPQGRLETLIRRFEELKEPLAALGERQDVRLPLTSVRLRPPVPRPTQFVCAIRNYLDGRPRSAEPDFFLKSPRTLMGDQDTVELPPVEAHVFQHEAEVALVIGRDGTDVPKEEAMSHVFGYTAFLDISARKIGNSFYLRKSFRTFGPLGPVLVTADEIVEPQALGVRMWVNDTLRQTFNTSQMDHSIDELISTVSRVSGLGVGDVIATGTYHLGMGPVQDGDVATVEIDQIGRLTAHVSDPSKRVWEVDPPQEGGV